MSNGHEFSLLGQHFPTPAGEDIVVSLGFGRAPNATLLSVYMAAGLCVAALVFAVTTRDRAAGFFVCFSAPFVSYMFLSFLTGSGPSRHVKIPCSDQPAVLHVGDRIQEINGIWLEHTDIPERRQRRRIPARTVHTLVVNLERFDFACDEDGRFCSRHCPDMQTWGLLVRVVSQRNRLEL